MVYDSITTRGLVLVTFAASGNTIFQSLETALGIAVELLDGLKSANKTGAGASPTNAKSGAKAPLFHKLKP